MRNANNDHSAKLNFSWIINGKLAGHRGPSSDQELAWLKKQGVLALVRMAEEQNSGVRNSQVEQLGLWDCYVPVPDFTAPNSLQIDTMIKFIDGSIAANRPVGVSCGAGMGRTGMLLACYLVSIGFEADAAISEVRKMRPGSIEVESQEDAVRAYGQSVSKR